MMCIMVLAGNPFVLSRHFANSCIPLLIYHAIVVFAAVAAVAATTAVAVLCCRNIIFGVRGLVIRILI